MDGGDWVAGFVLSTASRGGGARPRGGELAGDEGRRGSAGPWATWTAGEVGEGTGNLPVGTRSGQGHRRGAAHGEVARRWR
jgi:hypothetical protein